jgi:hypothetical protein
MSRPAQRQGLSCVTARNILVALSLSSLALLAFPHEARRLDRALVPYVLTVGTEVAGPPPVSGRQDGPLPPEIFR